MTKFNEGKFRTVSPFYCGHHNTKIRKTALQHRNFSGCGGVCMWEASRRRVSCEANMKANAGNLLGRTGIGLERRPCTSRSTAARRRSTALSHAGIKVAASQALASTDGTPITCLLALYPRSGRCARYREMRRGEPVTRIRQRHREIRGQDRVSRMDHQVARRSFANLHPPNPPPLFRFI